MQTVELFCGTKSFSKVAAEHGHNTFTVDCDEQFDPDLVANVLDLTPADFPEDIDILWASPPCQHFSVATIGRNWEKVDFSDYPIYKNEGAKQALRLLQHTVFLILKLKPKHFFIENPRGMMRKMQIVSIFNRHTVTYCQYGFDRMKPTDIWTLSDIELKPPCKNGDTCHKAAPRGSTTGTQGHGNAVDRGVIPPKLIEHILQQVEEQ